MNSRILDALLDAERTRSGFSTEERERLWKSVNEAISTATPPSAQAPDAAPPKPEPPAAAGSSFAETKLVTLLAVAALGGAGIGAAMHAYVAAPRVVFVERATESPTPSAAPLASASSSSGPASPAPVVTPTTPNTVQPVPSAKSNLPREADPKTFARDTRLSREQTLLDIARTALTRNDPNAALTALDTHSREFPSSQLVEERELMTIQALSAAHRTPEAQRRAAAFRARFPNSPLLPIVDEVIQ